MTPTMLNDITQQLEALEQRMEQLHGQVERIAPTNEHFDRQVMRDFQRFLQLPHDEKGCIIVDWRWHAYARGEMGAPPLLWEGDNS